jgi:glycosyltransferase involved in cell wall biosynthesis
MPNAVSVVIPAFNGSPHIGEALKSVFDQTLLPLEIIVVDDCSTDDTLDVIRRMASNAPIPVRTIRLLRNTGGPAKPINTGIKQARADLIAVLDQDDVFLSTKIEDQASAFRQQEDLVLVFGCCGKMHNPVELFHSQSILECLRAKATAGGNGLRLPGLDALRLFLTKENFVPGYPAFMFRRRHWEQKGGVDESLMIGSDFDFICWLFTQGPVGFVERVHYLRRYHDENMCNRTFSMLLDIATVRERYLSGQRWLSLDSDETKAMQGQFGFLAYWLREAGRYQDALYSLRLANRIWGCNVDRVLAVAKMIPHFLLHRLGWRGARFPNESANWRR